MTLRDSILGTTDHVTKEGYEIPEWGVVVDLRTLSAAERARAMSMATNDGEPDMALFNPAWIVMGLRDPETGERIFSDDDIHVLAQKNSDVISRVATDIMDINGASKESVENEGKGSPLTPNIDSGSSSPSDSGEQ